MDKQCEGENKKVLWRLFTMTSGDFFYSQAVMETVCKMKRKNCKLLQGFSILRSISSTILLATVLFIYHFITLASTNFSPFIHISYQSRTS